MGWSTLADSSTQPNDVEVSLTDEEKRELLDLITISKGNDPKAQSLVQELYRVQIPQEKSNFPTALNQQKQTYLLMCAETFGQELGEPFRIMAMIDALTWRGYKGFFSNLSKEMVKQGSDLGGVILNTQLPQAQSQQVSQPKRHWWNRDKSPESEVLEWVR